MSPGSTTSGVFGSTAPAGVVCGAGNVVAGAGTVVDVVGKVAGVEEAGTVVAFCVVDDWPVSLTGVGFVDPLESLHADANSITATPVAAIVDLIRMIHSLPVSG